MRTWIRAQHGGRAGAEGEGCAVQEAVGYPTAAILCTGGPDVIRKEAWPFYRTISGVRVCWELEEPKSPKELRQPSTKHVFPSLRHPALFPRLRIS